ncbi:MAG: hypothetical protein FJ091_12500 [Deltaproteobacteria bacterium]|nr:hypothetical protein [Deltaproteobacteria bacterium]
MSPFDTLSTLAQLSIALAGFSSVTVVFRRSGAQGAWLQEDVFRFKLMLRFSLLAGLLAMIPAVASNGAAAANAFPPALNVLSAVTVAVVFILARREGSGLARRLDRGVFALNLASIAAAVGLQLLGALRVVDGASAYIAGVAILASIAGLMFYRLTTIPLDEGR